MDAQERDAMAFLDAASSTCHTTNLATSTRLSSTEASDLPQLLADIPPDEVVTELLRARKMKRDLLRNVDATRTRPSTCPQYSISRFEEPFLAQNLRKYQSRHGEEPPSSPLRTLAAPRAVTPKIPNVLRNDYSQHFLDTGERPQNTIRDAPFPNRLLEYPKLQELMRLKAAHTAAHSLHPPLFLSTPDLGASTYDLALRLGSRCFDVILINPPTDPMDALISAERKPPGSRGKRRVWTWDQIAKLKIEDVAAVPSFVFLWTGDGDGLERGRDVLGKWGYRRAEDITWVKTNKTWRGSVRLGDPPVLLRQKEHCLVGIKGTLRRSIDTHFIHCNVDTDVIVAEDVPHGRRKPTEIYTIIENFCLGRRRLQIFGSDDTGRPGWVTVGPEVTISTFDPQAYPKFFESGGAVIPFHPDIEALRPKSPPPRNKR
ncbi:putative karyogamy protein KAR4 [Zopfochytrium polystomum]|nr:putative karyogamy protein KAR4 [Zopfochytrium polystomum]